MLNFNGVKEFKKDIGYGLEVIELNDQRSAQPHRGRFLKTHFRPISGRADRKAKRRKNAQSSKEYFLNSITS